MKRRAVAEVCEFFPPLPRKERGREKRREERTRKGKR